MIVDVEVSCARLGIDVATIVKNVAGEDYALAADRTVHADQASPEIKSIPYIIPIFTPGHRMAAFEDASHRGFKGAAAIVDPTAVVATSTTLGATWSRRISIASRYNEQLRTVPGVSPLRTVPSTTRMSWFIYVVRLDPTIDRNQVIAELAKDRIPSRVYFLPIHLQPFYRDRFGYREGDFPIAEQAAASILALPFHGNLSDSEIDCVVTSLQSAVMRSVR